MTAYRYTLRSFRWAVSSSSFSSMLAYSLFQNIFYVLYFIRCFIGLLEIIIGLVELRDLKVEQISFGLSDSLWGFNTTSDNPFPWTN